VKEKLQKRARRNRRSTEEEVRDILCNAVKEDSGPQLGLGSQIAALFAGLGLQEEIPEQRSQQPCLADFDS
jgi:plasmid stability protein